MKRRRKPKSASNARSVADDQVKRPQGNSSRRRRFKIAILVFSLLLFVTLDLVCGSLAINDQQRSFRRPHPYYHHGLRANQNRRTHWARHRYSMITNSLGFRDRETRHVPLQNDGRRVVLIGDSMVEGLGIDYEKTVTGQLAQRWAPQGVEVLNAGVVSYSPHLYYLKVRYLLEEVGLQFNQLVVFIDISDIQDETFYATFEPTTTQSRLVQWWQRHSLLFRVADLLTAAETRTNNQFRTEAEVNVWMETTEAYLGGTDPEIGRWQWTVNDTLYEQWGKKGLALARTHMLELSELCKQRGIELTVVIYPAPTQIFANDKDSRQQRFWQEFCEETGLTLIDLFPTFIDHSYEGPGEIYQRYFIPADMHWNAAGNRVVADKIDEIIGPAAQTQP